MTMFCIGEKRWSRYTSGGAPAPADHLQPLVATLLKSAGANSKACRLISDGYIILRLPMRETMPSQCARHGKTLESAAGVPRSGTCGFVGVLREPLHRANKNSLQEYTVETPTHLD
jgi:hypothetical protein